MQADIFVVSQYISYKKKPPSIAIIYLVIVRIAFCPNDILGTPSSQPAGNVRTQSGLDAEARWWRKQIRLDDCVGDGEWAHL